MALSGIQPFVKVTDSNGAPIVGARLYVYEPGTTTLRSIYSDTGLSVSLSNPLTGANASNASGDFPRFYMAAGTYKLRAETSAGVLIWQYDNIDTGLSAGSGALAISRGGTGATTAAAARAALDVPSNSELSDLSADITSFNTTLQGLVQTPGGRLTMTSATPILSTGVTAGTAVYYTPYVTDICPIYDGAQFNMRQFSEATLTLVSNHLASTIYDVFAIWDSGTFRVVTGPAWNTVTAGAGARGSGAGTTELTRQNGIWVNANAMATARNGSSTYAVSAKQGTYLGSLYMDGTNGQVSCLIAYGQSRKWGVWNAYNRVPHFMKAGDSTATWAYSTATFRASNNSSSNALTVFSGLPDEVVSLEFRATAALASSASSPTMVAGIGFNSTSAASGSTGAAANFATGTTMTFGITASYEAVPFIGINVFTALEKGAGSNTTTWNGTEAGNLLVARFRA